MTHGRRCQAFLTLAALGLAACTESNTREDVTPGSEKLHSERGGIGLEAPGEQTAGLTTPAVVDARRSLAVTEQAILDRFTLQRVLDQLAAQSSVPGLTGLQLFRQLWDTQNPAPGLGLGEHCTDNAGRFNDFPYACRPEEGAQANVDPFNPPGNPNSYRALGLFNRFDLAPTNGENCGEYRMVFGKSTASPGRNFIIFEAVLANPRPDRGLDGCWPVANFWASLSQENNLATRATRLENFFFLGFPGFDPVVHIDNYGNATDRTTGQVRTNQFIRPLWLLREFKLREGCDEFGCRLVFERATVKTNPAEELFNETSTHPKAAAFRAFFIDSIDELAQGNINTFNYAVPDTFNHGESDAQTASRTYASQFASSPNFRAAIQARITTLGLPLTPNQLVARAQALSCGGCHQTANNADVGFGAQRFPNSLAFTHTSEQTESSADGPRHLISPALTGTFLPHRKAVLEGFLNKPTTCGHDVCQLGGALQSGCSPCATVVCDNDSFCCTTEWDSACVDAAVALCARTTCP